MKYLLGLLLLVCCAASAVAQATLNLLDGKVFQISDYNDSTLSTVTYRYDANYFRNQKIRARNNALRKKIAGKAQEDGHYSLSKVDSTYERRRKALCPPDSGWGAIDKTDLFSLVDAAGKERVFYAPSPENGNYPVASMRTYIAGERDAILYHRGRGAFWSGVGVGLGAGYALKNSIFTFAVPFVFTLAVRLPTVKVGKGHVSDPSYMGNMDYLDGYAKSARDRDMMQGLKGSAIGIIAGMLLYGVINPDLVSYW